MEIERALAASATRRKVAGILWDSRARVSPDSFPAEDAKPDTWRDALELDDGAPDNVLVYEGDLCLDFSEDDEDGEGESETEGPFCPESTGSCFSGNRGSDWETYPGGGMVTLCNFDAAERPVMWSVVAGAKAGLDVWKETLDGIMYEFASTNIEVAPNEDWVGPQVGGFPLPGLRFNRHDRENLLTHLDIHMDRLVVEGRTLEQNMALIEAGGPDKLSPWAFVRFPEHLVSAPILDDWPNDPARVYLNLERTNALDDDPDEPPPIPSILVVQGLGVTLCWTNPLFWTLGLNLGVPLEEAPTYYTSLLTGQWVLHEATHLAWTCMTAEDNADGRFANSRRWGVLDGVNTLTPNDDLVYPNNTWEHRLYGLAQLAYSAVYAFQAVWADFYTGLAAQWFGPPEDLET